jgi:hypothetical protein
MPKKSNRRNEVSVEPLNMYGFILKTILTLIKD